MSSFETSALPDFPGGPAEPVFLEPWHAEVFSLAVALNQKGVFSWSEWAEVFSHALRKIPADGNESAEATYYRRWLAALEHLVAQRRLASREEMSTRKEEWRQAYLRTPHGQPIALERGIETLDAQHHEAPLAHSHTSRRHGADPAPAAISTAGERRGNAAKSTRAV